MDTYCVTHEHRHGVSNYVVTCVRVPTLEEVIDACSIDYEPEESEVLEVDRVTPTHIP